VIGVNNDMGHTKLRSFGLILEAAVFGAVIATVIAAAAMALFGGAGSEDRITTVGVGASRVTNRTHTWNPIEYGKATLWLCPFAAVSCGSFALIAALSGGGLMYRRARRLRSKARFTVEAAILGFLLACLFPFFDVWTGQVQGIQDLRYTAVDMLAPAFGCLCAWTCALFYRKRFFAAAADNGPSAPVR